MTFSQYQMKKAAKLNLDFYSLLTDVKKQLLVLELELYHSIAHKNNMIPSYLVIKQVLLLELDFLTIP